MKNKLGIATLLIVIGAIMRFLPHPHNMTPVAAMALLGGAYIGRKYLVFLVPLVILFLSDIVLNNTINRVFFTDTEGFILFQEYMLPVYLAFALTVLLGSLLKRFRGIKLVVSGAVLSSLLFFIVSNTGVWLSGMIYPKDMGGLLACFAAAIPFFWNTLIGNLLFTGLFVTGMEAAIKYFSLKETSAVTAK